MHKGRIVIEDHGTHGTSVDGNWSGAVRGVARDDDAGWCAITNSGGRYFKTAAGATRHLARFGYDAFGARL